MFLNTRKPDQRHQVLRFEDNQAFGLFSNICERHPNRPREQEQGYDFPNMWLLEFAMTFEPFYTRKVGDSEESFDAEE